MNRRAHLIIPAAGLSTRYGLSRPKFLLQHPEGMTMLAAGLRGLPRDGLAGATVVSLKAYFEDLDTAKIAAEVGEVLQTDVDFLLLDSPTASMVATINEAIRTFDDDDAIVIKDTDNYISVDAATAPYGGNFVAYADVRKFPHVVAANKSYVEIDAQDRVFNIVEKRVVSSEFNTGLVGFRSASEFLAMSQTLEAASRTYVSDIVRGLIDEGELFGAIEADVYEDWGTIKEWREYCRTFATIFADLDGTLVQNENPYGLTGGWTRFRPIEENLGWLLQRARSGRCRIVFTTSRSESYRSLLSEQLREHGFEQFDLVMGLPHAQRILINDFAPTNPYPSALAVNLPRNDPSMPSYLPFA